MNTNRTLTNNAPIVDLITYNPDTKVSKLKGVFMRIIQHFRKNPQYFNGYSDAQKNHILNMDDYSIIKLLIKKWKMHLEGQLTIGS